MGDPDGTVDPDGSRVSMQADPGCLCKQIRRYPLINTRFQAASSSLVVSKKTFAYVDHQMFLALIAWINRRHPEKSAQWKRQRYFRREGLRQWVFFAAIRDAQGSATHLDLFSVASVPITRHIKIQAHATPYNPAFTEYFIRRAEARRVSKLSWQGMTACA
ncbi:MAG: hypothetical protein A2075_02180 [Geobacteraceae bacterium GWC2_58_44]|nr:MAG: hypothetical protein A2075_02180 [Geobacteraceae bacterium GWC2_58_44]HBG05843.1 hypothetical protein [Geobacter sp.]